VHTFTDVEDEVPAVTGGEACSELTQVSDAVRLVAQQLQGLIDGGDGRLAVQFGSGFVVVSECEVLGTQVVSQPDSQGNSRHCRGR
jgi:hypothetical protein